ncbi:flagellar hook-length control protein FliK [Vreelandella malpeensis]|uniref:Flagellar hook-length control protein FliK n=1 Tax=Vreelandella malpeensis TaxID=1172368 RepID=A0ABS8DQB9_9GAMM|nr:flagellar hook-length control protein FliK [Halomonas malpeensis]
MSGITPLIDTLMHQVLGRQGEASQQRSINAPVQPVTPGEGPRALSRDASLDGRLTPAERNIDELRRLPPSLPQGGRPAPSPSGEAPPGSTQTHFSPAARSIADVLLRFPAPPAALRTEAPLMAAGEAPDARALAGRLDTSIRDSGLFYEAHLKRWFQGDVSRQQLLREPQMQLARPLAGHSPPMPANLPGASAVSGSPSAPLFTSILPGTPLLAVPVPQGAALLGAPVPLPAAAPATGALPTGAPGAMPDVDRPAFERTAAGVAPSSAAVSPSDESSARASALRDAAALREFEAISPHKREVVHESLQGLVRQQLEMLATPVLRWEGDVWAGVFMALLISAPGRRQGGEEESGGEQEQAWRSQMQLDVPEIGAFQIALSLYQTTLGVEIQAADEATRQRLAPAIDDLEARLGALDFARVRVVLTTSTEPN